MLLLAIVTDYCIFFLSDFRRELSAGVPRIPAATRATANTAPIVLVAGLIVAAGTACLLAGTLGFFRTFGPGLAVTALVGMLVTLTLLPAVLAAATGFVPGILSPIEVIVELPGIGERRAELAEF